MEEEKDYLEEEKIPWRNKLHRDVRGLIDKSPDNYIIFLENHPKYKGKLAYNEYTETREYDGKEFDDDTENIIYLDAMREMGFHSRDFLSAALSAVFTKNRYNPIIDYLKSLKWDGQKRIERLFIDLLEADDTELNRAMTRKWMVAAVKRCLIPGCKFDPMVILQGSGGIGKSTICERLAKGFYSSFSMDEIDDPKDLVSKMNKTWIGIVDEMDNFKKKDMNRIKSFLSETENTVRLAYARNAKAYKRHCVFIGSTNDETFLRDYTSPVERRFWIIKCNKTKMDSKIYDMMTPSYVDQLWAEAYQCYMDKPDQYLDLESGLFEDFAKTQKQYKIYNDDDLVEYVKEVLDKTYNIKEDGEVTDIAQIEDTSTGRQNKINKIQTSVLSKIVRQEFYKAENKIKYLADALSDEWKYKDVWFKSLGKSMKGFVRINPVKNSNKPYNPMDEFTVGLNE